MNFVVLTTIIELKIETNRLREVLETLREISTKIDTVFSVGIISRVGIDGSMPNVEIAKNVVFLPDQRQKQTLDLGDL